jgi:hypothetical protein
MVLILDTPLDEKFYVASLHNMFNNIAIEPNILLHKNSQQTSTGHKLIFDSSKIFLYGAMKYVENIHTRYSSQP